MAKSVIAGITKAYEIKNAKISYVSLVDKASNRKQFLITKAENGTANFQTYGRILKADAEAHYVTGIVYEPMVEDTQGNYMTEEEITKAAYLYAKIGKGADLQHNFEPLEGAVVVESYIAKCDEEINGETVKKGSWVMTMEITNPDIFSSIEKGEITGFSMGGVGQYSTEDVDISGDGTVEKTETVKKSMFEKFANSIGYDVIKKGKVKDNYLSRITSENFWQAFYALQDALFTWNWYADERIHESNPQVIQEALADFNEIVTGLLAGPEPEEVAKSVEGICKAGKKMSSANKDTLKNIHESLGEFLAKFEEEEETEVTKQEIQEIVKSAVAEALSQGGGEPKPIEKAANPVPTPQPTPEEKPLTKADIQNMIDTAIRKATGEEELPPETSEETDMQEAIAKAVSAAMEPFMKQAGLPTNLNDSSVQKSDEQHYLHGFI